MNPSQDRKDEHRLRKAVPNRLNASAASKAKLTAEHKAQLSAQLRAQSRVPLSTRRLRSDSMRANVSQADGTEHIVTHRFWHLKQLDCRFGPPSGISFKKGLKVTFNDLPTKKGGAYPEWLSPDVDTKVFPVRRGMFPIRFYVTRIKDAGIVEHREVTHRMMGVESDLEPSEYVMREERFDGRLPEVKQWEAATNAEMNEFAKFALWLVKAGRRKASRTFAQFMEDIDDVAMLLL
ncbi:hypothetical protein B9Z65_7022 [Elsinoe australis]|uniref:Uncharacterized protein n=1 Tax=Elsinoe australis TaxID=40998 RepID=A0A2P7Z4B8_9PEZI|nr:hypothetical protein B9Z65_7022 [Elsinoe australis]